MYCQKLEFDIIPTMLLFDYPQDRKSKAKSFLSIALFLVSPPNGIHNSTLKYFQPFLPNHIKFYLHKLKGHRLLAIFETSQTRISSDCPAKNSI